MPGEPKVTKLPDDWRLSPGASRKRALFGSLSPAEQKRAMKDERKRKYARRRRKKK